MFLAVAFVFAADTVDVELQGADVHAALRFLADAGHFDLVVADDVSGTVDLHLHHVTVDDALRALCLQKGLVAERAGNVVDVHR